MTELAPGARHVFLHFPAGPWAVHVIELDERTCAPHVEALKAGPPMEARAPTSELGSDALAAVNADFFMMPGGTPVGAHVSGGRVLIGPGSRPVYLLDLESRHHAGLALLSGFVAAGADSIELVQVNRPVRGGRHQPARPGLTLVDEWYGARAPVDSNGPTLRVRRASDGAGRGVVVGTTAAADAVPLDGGHVALQGHGAAATGWLSRRAPGDSVAWRAALEPAPAPGRTAAEAVGGFPVLVADGRGVYAEQAGVIESFGDARHPRTALGWDEDGRRLFWVVVDGRQAPYSAGMSLPELEWLFLRLGASDALNLDGGGSSTMVVRERVVNRPSDRTGERPVANALVLRSCDGGTGGAGHRAPSGAELRRSPPAP